MKFEIWKTRFKKHWRWRLRAANGEIVASGEAYHNKVDCLAGIVLVQSSVSAPVVELSAAQYRKIGK